MSLIPATKRHGSCVIRPADPEIEEHRDVGYIPMSAEAGRGWGVFNRRGQLVPATGFYRGPDHQLVMQDAERSLDAISVWDDPPESTYVYGGLLHAHYGHFLLSTLSRMWYLNKDDWREYKIIMHSTDLSKSWLTVPFVTELLAGLGLSEANFVNFERPTRIGKLIVPLPSFEENHFAHVAFATICHEIAGRISTTTTRNENPAYLAKTKLTSGVWRFVNEEEVVERLSLSGVDIIHPENCGVGEQIALFATRSVVCGAVGSAFHTSIFAAAPAHIIAYNHDDAIHSSYVLMDSINNTSAEYLYPPGQVETVQPNEYFQIQRRLTNPDRVAGDLLRRMEIACLRKRPMTNTSTASPVSLPLDTIGLRAGTDKSSFHHGYLDFYERFLREFQCLPGVKLLEVGVFDGASLRMWEEYFPDASIVGADINVASLQHSSARITIEVMDQSNLADLTKVAVTHGPFDIVVDDGSHFWEHQITTLRALFPFVKPGGYYILEDIDTSYGHNGDVYRGISETSAAEYLHRLCDYVVADKALDISREVDAFIRSYAPLTDFVAFYRRTCVVRRKPA